MAIRRNLSPAVSHPISNQKNRCGLVERLIAPWPSVAISTQPHQSHSSATAPSRLLIARSAKA
eukprot:scaffold200599_cov31-Attheya_sp.AAC.1